MKKKFYLILLTVFMVFALAACGGEADDDDDRDDKRVERSDKDNDDEDDDEDDKKDNDKDDKKDNDEDDKKDNDEDDKKDNEKDDKKDNDKDDDKDKDAAGEICGTWALEYDGSEQLSAQLGTDVTFTFTILMDFNTDNTMKMYVDPDTLKEEVNNSLVPVMTEMVYEQAAAQGLGDDRQAVDDAFNTAYGMGVEEFCAVSLAESLDGLAESFNTTSAYKAEGNKLYLADDNGSLSDYVLFTVDGDTMTLDDPSGAEEVEGLKLPLVLKRQ